LLRGTLALMLSSGIPMLVVLSLTVFVQSALSVADSELHNQHQDLAGGLDLDLKSAEAAPPPSSNINYMGKIYETIFGQYAGFNEQGRDGKTLPAAASINTRNGMFLSLMVPSHPIDEDGGTYANAWSDFNPMGNVSATVAFSQLVDVAPRMNALYEFDATRTISNAYGHILQNHHCHHDPQKKPTPEQEATYARAKAVLYYNTSVCVLDASTFKNKCSNQTVETPGWTNSQNKQQDYLDAKAPYMALWQSCNDDNWSPKAQRTWAFTSGDLYAKVKLAYQKYLATQPQLYLNAVAYLAQQYTATCESNFFNANEAFTAQKYATLAPGVFTHYAFTDSTSWYKAEDKSATCVKIHRNSTFGTADSDFHSFSEQTSGGGWGFSFSQYYDHSHTNDQRHFDSTDLEVDFCYRRVDIFRRWLDGYLLGGKWYIPDPATSQGAYSNGRRDPSNMNNTWPWTPQSFIVAKKIKICNSWSNADASFISDKLSHGASAGFNCGIFSLSGSYASNTTSANWKQSSTFDGTCITVNGSQIIAWMGTINPVWPPLDPEQL